MPLLVMKKAIQVSAYKRSSCALLGNGDILIWGRLLSGDTGHLIIESPANSISIGGDFLLINFHSTLSIGKSPISTSNTLSISPLSSLNIKSMSCGENHGLILIESGDIYSIGDGEVGQLGLGCDTCKAETPIKVNLPSAVLKIQCGEFISVAMTQSYIYIWGLINPDSLESANCIEWEPVALECNNAVPFKEFCIGGHELVAQDLNGDFYIWEWNYSRRLRTAHESFSSLTNIRRMAAGKSMQHLVEGIIQPEKTVLISCDTECYGNTPFTLSMQLFDQFGPIKYQNPNISLIVKRDFIQDRDIKPTDSSFYPISFQESTSLDTNNYTILINGIGEIYLHIFIHHQQLKESPIRIILNPTPEQEELLQQQQEQERLEKERQELLEAKRIAMEEEKRREKVYKEEQEKKKKLDTDRRAREALKSHRERREQEKKSKEAEKKRRAEIQTGGGFDLNKLKTAR